VKITPLDIRRKEFKRSVRGYSDEEVDIFLDEVADEFERLYQENMELQDRMRRLDEQQSGHAQLKDALEKTLVSAQLQSEELRANAHKERELILRDAEMKARDIVSGSYGETQKTQQTLVQLKMLEEDFRIKFRSLLEGYLRLLNQAPITPPGGDAHVPAVTGAEPAVAAAASRSAEPAAAPAPAAAPPVVTPAAAQAPVAGPPAVAIVAEPPVTALPVEVPAPVPPVPASVAASVAPVERPVVAAPAAVPQPRPAAPLPAPAPYADGGGASVFQRPVPPAPQAPPLLSDEAPTAETTLTREPQPLPSPGSAMEPTVEMAPLSDNTIDGLWAGNSFASPGKGAEEEPLHRFFFGRRTSDDDDTFQSEDDFKKDKSRDFEW